MRVFGDFLHEQKATRGVGLEAPQNQSTETQFRHGETCFVPTRPAIGESERIGAVRWQKLSWEESTETQFL